jgi:hypothetical protein
MASPLDTSRFDKRVAAACKKILARSDADETCLIALVDRQKRTDFDGPLFDRVAKLSREPWPANSHPTAFRLFRVLADERAVALVVQSWRDAIPIADAKEKQHAHEAMLYWAAWRQEAAVTIGALSTSPDDAEFLRAQARATRDSYVRAACLDAAGAIDKRKK